MDRQDCVLALRPPYMHSTEQYLYKYTSTAFDWEQPVRVNHVHGSMLVIQAGQDLYKYTIDNLGPL